MSDQPENEMQQSMSPEEMRQSLLAELDASQQAIAELSDEELEQVAGGALGRPAMPNLGNAVRWIREPLEKGRKVYNLLKMVSH